jgi:hypothetical protein
MKKYFLCVLVLCSLLLNAKQTEVYIQPNLILKYDEQKWPTYNNYYINHDVFFNNDNELLGRVLNDDYQVHGSIVSNKYICYDSYLISDSLEKNRLQINKIENVPTKYNNPTNINYYFIKKELYNTSIVNKVDEAYNKQYKQFAVFHYPNVTQKSTTNKVINNFFLAYYFEGKTVYAIQGAFEKNTNEAKADFYEILDNIEFTTPERYDKNTVMPISNKEVDMLLAEMKNKLHDIVYSFLEINTDNTPYQKQINARTFAKLLEYKYGSSQGANDNKIGSKVNIDEQIARLEEYIKLNINSSKIHIYIDSLENLYSQINVPEHDYGYYDDGYNVAFDAFTTDSKYLQYDSIPFASIKKYINEYLPSIIDTIVNRNVRNYYNDTFEIHRIYNFCNAIYDARKQNKPQEEIDDLMLEFNEAYKVQYKYTDRISNNDINWSDMFLGSEVGRQLENLIRGALDDYAQQFTATKFVNDYKELQKNVSIEDYLEFTDNPFVKNNLLTNYVMQNYNTEESKFYLVDRINKYIDEKILKDPIKTYSFEEIFDINSMHLNEEQIFNRTEPQTHWYVAHLYDSDNLSTRIKDSVLLVSFRLNENRVLFCNYKFIKINNTKNLEFNIINRFKIDENKNYIQLYEYGKKIDENNYDEISIVPDYIQKIEKSSIRIHLLNYKAINNSYATIELPKKLFGNYKYVYSNCSYNQVGCGDKAIFNFREGDLIVDDIQNSKSEAYKSIEKNIQTLERKVDVLDSMALEFDDNTQEKYTEILLKKSYNNYLEFLRYANELDSMRTVDLEDKYYSKIDVERAKIIKLRDLLYKLEDEQKIDAKEVISFSDAVFEDLDYDGNIEAIVLGASNGDLIYYDAYTIKNNQVEKYKNQNTKKQIQNTTACKSFLKFSKIVNRNTVEVIEEY